MRVSGETWLKASDICDRIGMLPKFGLSDDRVQQRHEQADTDGFCQRAKHAEHDKSDEQLLFVTDVFPARRQKNAILLQSQPQAGSLLHPGCRAVSGAARAPARV